MRRSTLVITAFLLAASGCGLHEQEHPIVTGTAPDGAPDAGAPSSSLQACDFDTPCGDSHETCDVSQVCGINTGCDPVQGDLKCHRLCTTDADCAPTEQCTAVSYAARVDGIQTHHLCLAR